MKHLFFLLFFISAHAHAEDLFIDGILFDNKTVSNLITVITTTNPIPTIPKTDILYESQRSLHQIPALKNCKKIIVFDGIQPSYKNRKDDYDLYKQRVQELTETDPYFANTELVFCENWVHLSGAIRQALETVETPYLFIHQHDFLLVKSFDLNAIIATMYLNPLILHVRPALKKRNGDAIRWNRHIDENIPGPHFVPLTRIFGWSDNDHITTLNYYTEFVLPKCKHGPMEEYLNKEMGKAYKELGLDSHAQYGTYYLGSIDDGGYFENLDGRKTK